MKNDQSDAVMTYSTIHTRKDWAFLDELDFVSPSILSTYCSSIDYESRKSEQKDITEK
jgi:hypothetical protein